MKYKNILFKLILLIFSVGLISTTMAQPAVPVLVTPSQNATGVAMTPTFVWDSVATASQWQLQLSTDNFATTFYTSGTLHDTVFTYPGTLASETKYWWKVRASDGFNSSAFSAPDSFTTLFVVSAPTVPVLGYPADSTWRMPDSLTFTWSNPGNQDTAFEIQITQDPTFHYVEIDSSGITGTSYNVIHKLQTGVYYYWRVQGRNSKGVSTWTSRRVFKVTIDGVKGPGVPHLNWPIDSSDVYNDTTVLVWNKPYADSSLVFDVQMASDSGYTRGVQSFTSIDTTSLRVVNLISDSTYYWKVRSRDHIHPDTSNFSASSIFHVSRSSTHPLLAWPIGGGYVYQVSQTFSWYLNGVAPGIKFQFTLAKNSNLLTPDTIASNLSTKFVTFYHLRSGLTYYWQVISTIPGGHVDSSAIDSFKVVPNVGPVTPTLGWPVGGGIVYTNKPTLVWSINSTGLGLSYDVQYSLNKLTLPTSTVYNTGALSLGIGPLLSDTLYYWRVRSKNGTDSSAYTAIDSFKVAGGSGNPVVPIPSAPIGGIQVHTNMPTFSWYLDSASVNLTYEIRYARSLSGLSLATIYSGVINNYYTIPPANQLPLDTIYFWQVRSRSAFNDSSAFCSPDSFWVSTGSGNPVIPIPSWPIGGLTVYPNPPALNWYMNTSPQGLNYKVQYTTDNSFGSYTEKAGLTINTYQIPAILPIGVTYYWRVKSYNITTGDSSGWSPTESFVTPAFLNAATPQVGSPANGVKLQVSNPMLTWYLPTFDPSVTSYDVQYSTKSDFSSAVSIPNLSKTNQIISSLQPGELYYWRVRSNATNGTISSYSYSGNFYSAGITGVKNDQVIPYKFAVEQNYPNPFNPSTQIRYSIPKSSLVTITIYNILGQEVRTLINESQVAGNYSVQWNGKNNFGMQVGTGVYIYRVVAGLNVASKKMILLK